MNKICDEKQYFESMKFNILKFNKKNGYPGNEIIVFGKWKINCQDREIQNEILTETEELGFKKLICKGINL